MHHGHFIMSQLSLPGSLMRGLARGPNREQNDNKKRSQISTKVTYVGILSFGFLSLLFVSFCVHFLFSFCVLLGSFRFPVAFLCFPFVSSVAFLFFLSEFPLLSFCFLLLHFVLFLFPSVFLYAATHMVKTLSKRIRRENNDNNLREQQFYIYCFFLFFF